MKETRRMRRQMCTMILQFCIFLGDGNHLRYNKSDGSVSMGIKYEFLCMYAHNREVLLYKKNF